MGSSRNNHLADSDNRIASDPNRPLRSLQAGAQYFYRAMVGMPGVSRADAKEPNDAMNLLKDHLRAFDKAEPGPEYRVDWFCPEKLVKGLTGNPEKDIKKLERKYPKRRTQKHFKVEDGKVVCYSTENQAGLWRRINFPIRHSYIDGIRDVKASMICHKSLGSTQPAMELITVNWDDTTLPEIFICANTVLFDYGDYQEMMDSKGDVELLEGDDMLSAEKFFAMRMGNHDLVCMVELIQ